GQKAMKCVAQSDVSTPQLARSANPDQRYNASTTGAPCAASPSRSVRSSAASSGTTRIDPCDADGCAAATVPRASYTAVASTYADRLNRTAMFSSAQSGTQPNRRYGAITIADVQPKWSAKEPAMVRRSSVRERAPMRSSSALNGPVVASRKSSPRIHPPSIGRPTSTAQPGASARNRSYMAATGDGESALTRAAASLPLGRTRARATAARGRRQANRRGAAGG